MATLDTGGEVRNEAHPELELVEMQACKSTSPPVANLTQLR